MKYSWLHSGGNSRLIVFCNGWGMDCNPLRPLASNEYDVLNLHDFRNLENISEILDILHEYPERNLVSWSMGVWAGQNLFSGTNRFFKLTVAINGTLCPVHDTFGIPENLFAGTLNGWSDVSRSKFYHRLCGNRHILRCFLENQPDRTLADQQDELACYLEVAGCTEMKDSIYNKVVVSDNDRIVPSANQLAFWGQDNVMLVRGSHFPFYDWKCWDDLLDDVAPL